MTYKRILTFDLQVLYSPHELVHFLGFFTSWIWIRIQEDFLNADPQHWLEFKLSFYSTENMGTGTYDFTLTVQCYLYS